MKPLKLLLIEDSERDAARLTLELRRGGFDPDITRVETAERLKEQLSATRYDMVISDYCLPSFSAPDALKIVQESGQDVPFIVVSGAVGEEIAVEMMRSGAQDYVLKQKLTRLVPAVTREIEDASQRRERRKTQTLFQAILRSAPIPTALVDCKTFHVIHYSDSFGSLFGAGGNSLRDRSLFDVVDFSHPVRVQQLLDRSSGVVPGLVYAVAGQKRIANVRVYSATHDGTRYANVVIEDVTDQQHLKTAFDAIADAVLIVSAEEKLLYANRAAEELLGQLFFDMDVRPVLGLPSLRESWWKMTTARFEAPRINLGEQIWEASVVPFRYAGEKEISTIITMRNVSEEEKLIEMSTHDALTGLFNVRHFNVALEKAVEGISRGEPAVLAIIDLDYFKPINDELGHIAGDAALMRFTNILRRELGSSALLARVGGDEFAILFPNSTLETATAAISAFYLTLPQSRFVFDNVERTLSASCGIGALAEGETGEEAKNRVDAALYSAKKSGRGRFVVARMPSLT